MKWPELYKTEADLIKDLKTVNVEDFKRKLYKGYLFIESFQKYLQTHEKLTKKQMTQVKRLAYEIYKYHNWN